MRSESRAGGAFAPGDSIAWRVRVRTETSARDDLSYVSARRLVYDTPDEVAVFARRGYPAKRRNAIFGGPTTQRHPSVVGWLGGWTDEAWGVWRLLTLKRPADNHSISAAWHEETGEFHWYIDLTSPLRRMTAGFELVEHGLDIVVDPDAIAFKWKDEDELATAVERGTYTRAEATDLYSEGERAVERLRGDRRAFEKWLSWTPDPSWPPPQLPSGWDAP